MGDARMVTVIPSNLFFAGALLGNTMLQMSAVRRSALAMPRRRSTMSPAQRRMVSPAGASLIVVPRGTRSQFR